MLSYKRGLKRAVSADNVKTVKPYNFSNNTTYGLGGNAKVAYVPKTIWQAKCAYDVIKKSGENCLILGLGSNVLVSDCGYDGSLISTREMRGIIKVDENRLFCLAGTKLCDLLKYCKNNNLSGLEYLYGIPATVGGAAYMNAGVCGYAIGDNISKVAIYNGKNSILSRKDCNFTYRHSTMRDINAIILSIIVNVSNGRSEEIEEKINFFKDRRAHLPKGKSCGCVFKNPDGQSAGYLIEAAGLKGFSIGGATVSQNHASFIINRGGTASDVKAVIDFVKRVVFDKFGVCLSEEVVYIGEFNDFNG